MIVLILLLILTGGAAATALQDAPVNNKFCLQCGQAFTVLPDVRQDAEAVRVEADDVAIAPQGIDITLVTADEETAYLVDEGRLAWLVDAIAGIVPAEYRRRSVASITILLSSEVYALHYDDWTPEQQRRLTEPYADYFTSERRTRNIAGGCMSFPGNDETERVIWLPLGRVIGREGTYAEHVNCAYSYHLYGTEESLLMASLAHELTHALTLTVTMPSLEDYGFTANRVWALKQRTTGTDDAELYSVEALAYDTTLALLRRHEPVDLLDLEPLEFPLMIAPVGLTWSLVPEYGQEE